MMVQTKIYRQTNSHYLFESKSWIRLVEFFIQENAIMKTRLSEVMYQIQNRETLANAERFQDRFCIKDDVLEHMINDLKIECKKWDLYNRKDEKIFLNEMKIIHLTHRLDIERLVNTLDILKKDYNTFLSSLETSNSDILN